MKQQSSVKRLKGVRRTSQANASFYEVTSNLCYFCRTYEAQVSCPSPTDDTTSTGKTLWSEKERKRGNKVRSVLSRPEQPGTDSLIGEREL